MTPVFHQGWNLFAPDPPLKEKTLTYRVKTAEGWSDWLNPGKELLAQHDQWRLSNANIAFRLHQNAAFRVWEEHFRAQENMASRGKDFDYREYVFNSRGYRTAKFYALGQFGRSHSGVEVDSLQLRLLIDSPPPFPGAQGEWKMQYIKFPADEAE